MRYPLLAVLVLCPLASRADDLPSMPLPKIASESVLGVRTTFYGLHTPPFWDKAAYAGAVATVGLLAADSIQTCHNLATGGHEDWLHTQRCSTAVLEMSAERVLAWGAAYAFHRAGHHKIERIFEWVGPAGNAAGLAYSAEQPRRQLNLHCTAVRPGYSSCSIY